MPTRRLLLEAASCTAAAIALPALSAPAAGAHGAWPQKPITLVDPFPAGGSTDYFSRALADRLGPLLGTQVIVENRPGAGGIVGAGYVAKARPDGYTLGLATVSTLCAGPAVHPYASVRYDPLTEFAHITKLVTLPSLLATSLKLPARDFPELLALARAQPGRITCGVPGIGSAGHVLLEYMMKLAGVRFLPVPYKGGAAMLTDLISGQLDVLSDNIPLVLPHVRAGAVRAVAVRDTRRLPTLPGVPTYKELGLPEVSQPLWFGLVAPAGTPTAVQDRLRAMTHKALVDSGFLDRALAVSASVSPSGAEFAADARTLLAQLRQVVKEAGIKPE